MKRSHIYCLILLWSGLLSKIGLCQSESEASATIPVAILRFQDLDGQGKSANPARRIDDVPRIKEDENKSDLGQKVSTMLFAELAASPTLVLVEREEIDKVIDELELSLSRIIDPASANQIGRMTGAKVLISGSVMRVESSLYVIAKIIGTETTRVLGASAKGPIEDGITPLVEKVAKDIAIAIEQRSQSLLPKVKSEAERIELIRTKIAGMERPTVSIKVSELHFSRRAIDPAAETELSLIFKELGFTVLDSATEEGKKADVELTGEGMAEFAIRRKNLVSVKARVEIKATDKRSKQVLAADRQSTMAVDLTEIIAGKSALQQAALEIAERIIPKLMEAKKKMTK